MREPTKDMIIDRVDTNDNVVGTIARDQVFKEQANFRVSHVFLVNHNGDLLLQTVVSGRERYPGAWGSSVSAYLFSGESYSAAATRRLEQELQIKGLELDRFGKTHEMDRGCMKFITLFTTSTDMEIHPDPSQVGQARFFSIQEIAQTRENGRNLFTPTFLRVLDFYLEGRDA